MVAKIGIEFICNHLNSLKLNLEVLKKFYCLLKIKF